MRSLAQDLPYAVRLFRRSPKLEAEQLADIVDREIESYV
jgi:hypothetical protein